MHCPALSDISIFMEHRITIRYSTSVSIYCDIDMYCRSLCDGHAQSCDENTKAHENLRMKFKRL